MHESLTRRLSQMAGWLQLLSHLAIAESPLLEMFKGEGSGFVPGSYRNSVNFQKVNIFLLWTPYLKLMAKILTNGLTSDHWICAFNYRQWQNKCWMKKCVTSHSNTCFVVKSTRVTNCGKIRSILPMARFWQCHLLKGIISSSQISPYRRYFDEFAQLVSLHS